MSDTEDESTFDKEAEREKLRKQLEREEEERRSTQHMSELLLKGATMTNRHCDTCGDPLFRYEGQEFCPTCGQGGQAGGENQQAAAEGDADGPPDAAGQPAGIDRVETGAPAETAQSRSPDVDEGDEAAASGSTGQQPPQSGGLVQPQQPAAQARGATSQGVGGDAGSAGGTGATGNVGAAGDATGNVANARAALSRKLASLARQAETTEDVGRSRELLAAAREAADALAAIDDVGR